MADELEDFESVDADRNIDRCSFEANQFDIFTHDYRENGKPACKDTDGDHKNCQHDEEEMKKSKKELINVTRRLKRALVSLELMSGSELVSDLFQAIQDINTQLQSAILKNDQEFSTTTVALPEFDSDDMQLFLGNEQIPKQESMLEKVNNEQKSTREKIDLVIAQANILLQEYDHIKNGLPHRI